MTRALFAVLVVTLLASCDAPPPDGMKPVYLGDDYRLYLEVKTGCSLKVEFATGNVTKQCPTNEATR